jgi:UDP-2,3-diacylglucosamine pyrophosphatase LpxH
MDRARGVRHTVVISDVHLTEEVPGDDAWLRYRQRRFFPDRDFAVLVRHLLERVVAIGDRLELVLDGDVIEFETPRLVDGQSFADSPRTEEEAVATLSAVVRDHPVFFEHLARVASAGHRVVFVAGNHDVHLALPGVRAALQAAIAKMLPSAEDSANVTVQPWFHQTDDGVHVEHGHQYDAYCSFRDPLRPLDTEGVEVAPTVGSLAFRHMISRMGYFNAYDERSFMLSVPRYLAHWARYYLFTRRSLGITWFAGALKVVAEILKSRPDRALMKTIREQAAIARAAYAQTLALDAKALSAHADLFAEPVDANPHRVVREMRLDHAALAAVAVGGLVTAAFKPKLGLAMMFGAILVGVVQEIIAPHEPAHGEYRRVESVAMSIAKIYNARAIVFGHTHVPHATFEGGVLYANAGSWAPPVEETHAEPPVDERETRQKKGRPVVWVRRADGDRDAPLEGGLYRLVDGALVPANVISAREAEQTEAAGAKLLAATKTT